MMGTEVAADYLAICIEFHNYNLDGFYPDYPVSTEGVQDG
tara:strand:- start:95 stop:214 length:120 start_codon:yes stop_codon:yes gene_type:complete